MWAIRKTGNKHPIQRSTKSFVTEDEAQQDGQDALNGLLEILKAQNARRQRGDGGQASKEAP